MATPGPMLKRLWALRSSRRRDPRRPLAPVGELLGRLEARVKASPDNVGHWTLLAQSYAHLGRPADAARAAGRAIELGADAAMLNAQLRQASGAL